MAFLAALVSDLITKIVTWLGGLLVKEYKQHEKIVSDDEKAAENADALKKATTKEEENKDDENLLNGR